MDQAPSSNPLVYLHSESIGDTSDEEEEEDDEEQEEEEEEYDEMEDVCDETLSEKVFLTLQNLFYQGSVMKTLSEKVIIYLHREL